MRNYREGMCKDELPAQVDMIGQRGATNDILPGVKVRFSGDCFANIAPEMRKIRDIPGIIAQKCRFLSAYICIILLYR